MLQNYLVNGSGENVNNRGGIVILKRTTGEWQFGKMISNDASCTLPN